MNNIFTYTIIVFLFTAIFGAINIIGGEALIKNENLDDESIAEIAGIDTSLYKDLEVNTTTGTISGISYNSSTTALEGASPEDREYLQSRKDVKDFETGYGDIIKIPETMVNSIPFVNYNDSVFFLSLLTLLISIGLGLVFYKSWRTGRVDND